MIELNPRSKIYIGTHNQEIEVEEFKFHYNMIEYFEKDTDTMTFDAENITILNLVLKAKHIQFKAEPDAYMPFAFRSSAIRSLRFANVNSENAHFIENKAHLMAKISPDTVIDYTLEFIPELMRFHKFEQLVLDTEETVDIFCANIKPNTKISIERLLCHMTNELHF